MATPPDNYYGKILKQFDWSLRKAPDRITHPRTPFQKLSRHAFNYSTGPIHFNLRETNKMNIQEKDCRRCEKFNEEGYCIHEPNNKFKPDIATCCFSEFTPVQGRDCRNCERFNGIEKDCADKEGCRNWAANYPKNACKDFDPLSTSKPSPTTLTYTDEDEDTFRVIKGDKKLTLDNIFSERPCGNEYRKMSVVFTQAGFNPDTEIDFQQDNLDRLSDLAFHWLLEEDFLIKAEEEKPVYKVGQWFKLESDPRNLYVLCEGREPQSVLLIRVFGHLEPTQCSPGKWNTIKQVDIGPGQAHWQNLIPIDPPVIKA